MPPEAALAKLKLGNKRFAGDRLANHDMDAKRRQELLAGQKPFAIILTCSDSRVVPEYIFDQGLGELMVLRVAGNVANASVIGSIEEALQTLPVRLVVVMGHNRCETIKAALQPPGEKEEKTGQAWLYKQIDVGKNLPKDPKEALAVAAKNNVLHQAQILTENSSIVRQFVLSTRVQIVPAMYDLASGKVEWMDAAKASGRQVAFIRVLLPTPDADVYLDGRKTTSRGLERIYEVPPIDVNREYTYEVRAEWREGAQTLMPSRIVRFKGGQTVTVDFSAK